MTGPTGEELHQAQEHPGSLDTEELGQPLVAKRSSATTPPPEIQAILSKLPVGPERKILEQSISMMFQGPMSTAHPILAKLDGQHLTKILDGVENESKRDHEDRDQGRKHMRFIAVVGLAGFLLISALFLWANAGELLKGILMGFAVFAGGLGFGSRFLHKKDDE